MPISEKLPTWAVVPAVLAVFSVIFYQILIAPDNLNGTKNVLSMAKTIPLPVDGPESIEWDPQGGGPYAAVVDGRILKWRGDGLGWVEFAYTSPRRGNCSRHEVVPTCGRPLGLSFEKKTGDLYICDGYLGVMKVGPEGGLAELVVDQAEGRKVMFANQMDIDEEEDVFYFNDSSDKYHFRDVFYVIVNGERPGRVIRYNKKTKEAKVVMDNLRCNNGLALNKDRSFLVSCESATGLVHRYWIKGPKAGTRDIFAKVPGYPDNIRLTPTGDFWIGIHCKKNLLGRLVVNNQWLGKLVEKTVKLELLIGLVNGFKPHGVAVKISGETGEIVEILEDKEGKTMQYVSEAYERDDGKIWFGSVFTPAVWVLDRNYMKERDKTPELAKDVQSLQCSQTLGGRRQESTRSLFSSLRSCLPASDQTKKLSIPQTVSRSLKYIPELQEQVKKLIQKKEELLVRVSGQRAIEHYVEPQPKAVARYVSTISATKLGDNEVMVQISSSKNHNFSISNVLSGLEEDGFVLVDVSSSRYHGKWLFYSLHLQMGNKDNHKLKCEELGQRILYLYEECENSFR
uniref:Strictosidine synthase conserved region domain-containing protein n=1 Tax=Brassica oleracea var. oleracea TaxID=109376 RepID=A0A0D2ZRR2_BRAOL